MRALPRSVGSPLSDGCNQSVAEAIASAASDTTALCVKAPPNANAAGLWENFSFY
jgi:hypothetical protein